PEKCRRALEALGKAIDLGQKWRTRWEFSKTWRDFNQLEVTARNRAGLWLVAAKGSWQKFARFISEPALAPQMSARGNVTRGRILCAWAEQRQFSRLTSWARTLAKRAKGRCSDNNVDVWLYLVELICLDEPGPANVLLNHAFAFLTPEVRRDVLPNVESRIAM